MRKRIGFYFMLVLAVLTAIGFGVFLIWILDLLFYETLGFERSRLIWIIQLAAFLIGGRLAGRVFSRWAKRFGY